MWLKALLLALFIGVLLADDGAPKFKGTNIDYIREKLALIRKAARVENQPDTNGDQLPPVPGADDHKPKPAQGIPIQSLATIQDVNARSTFGDSFYQGDIVLNKAQIDRMVKETLGDRKARQAIAGVNFSTSLWKSPIAYYIDDAYSDSDRNFVELALAKWSSVTCIDFKEDRTAVDRLKYMKGAGCFSSLGRGGGEQEISLGLGCQSIGHAIHETGHALGFYHTHARYDRDEFINIHVENILKDWEDQFKLETKESNDNYGLTYDYGSVMHYPGSSAAKQFPLITMEAKDPDYQKTMGSYILGFYDAMMMNIRYNCLDKCKSSETKCANGGYPNPKNCNKCNCPSGFGGDLCDQRPTGCGETYKALSEWSKMNDTVGRRIAGFDPDYTYCNYWITSPPGTKIELKVERFFGGNCYEGCWTNGVEIKNQDDMRRTGYRFCCDAHAGHSYMSKRNVVPIITYNMYLIQDVVLLFRYVPDNDIVGTTSTPLPEATTTRASSLETTEPSATTPITTDSPTTTISAEPITTEGTESSTLPTESVSSTDSPTTTSSETTTESFTEPTTTAETTSSAATTSTETETTMIETQPTSAESITPENISTGTMPSTISDEDYKTISGTETSTTIGSHTCMDNFKSSCETLQSEYNFCEDTDLGRYYTKAEKKAYCAKTCQLCDS